jgi:hypothetical protein
VKSIRSIQSYPREGPLPRDPFCVVPSAPIQPIRLSQVIIRGHRSPELRQHWKIMLTELVPTRLVRAVNLRCRLFISVRRTFICPIL